MLTSLHVSTIEAPAIHSLYSAQIMLSVVCVLIFIAALCDCLLESLVCGCILHVHFFLSLCNTEKYFFIVSIQSNKLSSIIIASLPQGSVCIVHRDNHIYSCSTAPAPCMQGHAGCFRCQEGKSIMHVVGYFLDKGADSLKDVGV